jgi:hypothetical protein
VRLRDRTIVAGVSVIVVVLLALFLSGTVNLTVHLPTVTNQVATTTTSLTNPTTTGQVNPIVKITVDAGQRASKWVSGLDDLPYYEAGVSWNVCNEGTAKADNTVIVVKSDDVVITKLTGPLDSNSCSGSHADLEYSYDTTHQVTVEASAGQSRDSKLLVITAMLPRALLALQPAPTSDIVEAAKVFVTPKDPVVLHALRDLFFAWAGGYMHGGVIDRSYIYHCPDGVFQWMGEGACKDHAEVLRAIQLWVEDRFIHQQQPYCPDMDSSEYVQLPRETLQSGKGSQTDRVLLTVSLARAVGVGSDEVFVVLGRSAEKAIGIGWVRLDGARKDSDFNRDWRFPPSCQNGVQAVYYFNDEKAVTGNFGPEASSPASLAGETFRVLVTLGPIASLTHRTPENGACTHGRFTASTTK